MGKLLTYSTILRVIVLTAAALFQACGPGIAEGEIADTETDDTESGGTASDPVEIRIPCPTEIDSTCPGEAYFPIPEPVLAAADFSETTRFLAMAPSIILATEDVDGAPQPFTITVHFAEDAIDYPLIARLPTGAAGQEPITVFTCGSSFANGFYRMAMFRADGIYRFYGVPDKNDTTTLIHQPQLDLADDSNFMGAVFLDHRTPLESSEHPELNTLCLFGDGLVCSDGSTWQRELAADGPRVNAVGVAVENGKPVIIAVGDSGSVRIRKEFTWSTVPAITDANLRTISSIPDGSRFTIAGAGGVMINTALSFVDPTICTAQDEDILNVSYSEDDPDHFFYALTASGQLYSGYLGPDRSGMICRDPFQSATSPIIGHPMPTTFFVLTADTVYGAIFHLTNID